MKDQTVFNSLPEQALETLEEVKEEVPTSMQKMCSAVNALFSFSDTSQQLSRS
jgi:hypothetical protein